MGEITDGVTVLVEEPAIYGTAELQKTLAERRDELIEEVNQYTAHWQPLVDGLFSRKEEFSRYGEALTKLMDPYAGMLRPNAAFDDAVNYYVAAQHDWAFGVLSEAYKAQRNLGHNWKCRKIAKKLETRFREIMADTSPYVGGGPVVRKAAAYYAEEMEKSGGREQFEEIEKIRKKSPNYSGAAFQSLQALNEAVERAAYLRYRGEDQVPLPQDIFAKPALLVSFDLQQRVVKSPYYAGSDKKLAPPLSEIRNKPEFRAVADEFGIPKAFHDLEAFEMTRGISTFDPEAVNSRVREFEAKVRFWGPRKHSTGSLDVL